MWGVLMRGLIDVNFPELYASIVAIIVRILAHYICLSVGLIAGTWMGYEMSKAPEVPDYE